MLVLGIETSCDETAAAVVNGKGEILSNIVLSQLDEHRAYGGVVPEIAARAHIQHLDRIISEAMKEAGVGYNELTAIAATGGPGLIGGVMVGVMTAKAIAAFYQKPFLAVNHLEDHALTARMSSDVDFPFLLLLVSGGHCQLLLAESFGTYHRLGGTKDDALGEAFDKVAKMLGLCYPGGPKVEEYATKGNPVRFALPKPLMGTTGCDFSFSGLKTAVSRTIAANQPVDDALCADICASFQYTVADVLRDRLGNAMKEHDARVSTRKKALVIAGGVAANQYIRAQLSELCDKNGFVLCIPPAKLCTDNAAMIAWAGIERLRQGLPADSMYFEPKARWPIFS